jgi:putative restriction endonuclease
MSRRDDAIRIAQLVGGGILTLTNPQVGWPAQGTLDLNGDHLQVNLFAGPVTGSSRGRDAAERRFQNPGSNRPIVLDPGRYPLLLGLLERDPALQIDKPLLVRADPLRRASLITRYSIFTSVSSLMEASTTGWSQHVNTSGETIHSFVAQLLPVVVSAIREDALPAPAPLQAAIEASGLMYVPEPEIDAAAQRARRATYSLVRNRDFANKVVAAYDGRCAMCGLGADLVQAAHIYPASAPGSHDQPWNGLALCPNHHIAFDHHLIAVRPSTREIVISDTLHNQTNETPAMLAFVSATFARLAEPTGRTARPMSSMFASRYQFYSTLYDWAGDITT